MAEILHTADTHLGYTQYHLEEREQDFFDAFVKVIDDAIEHDVDAVVHAGDLFQNSRPDTSVLIRTFTELQRLSDAGIPFLAVVGNHDQTNDDQWIDIFDKVELAKRLGTSPVIIEDTALYGLDYVSPARRTQLNYQFDEHDVDYAALVAHGLMRPLSHSQWEAGEILSQSNVRFDALLLGDDHKPNTTNLNGTVMTYSGSTERTDSDQRKDRGYNMVTFAENAFTDTDGNTHPVEVERNYINTREFLYLEEELEDGEDASVIRERLDFETLDDTVTVFELYGDGEPILKGPIEEYARQNGALTLKLYDRREHADSEAPSSEVRFEDPRVAIKERIREMGLSAPAHDLENIVREKEVSKSKLSDKAQDDIADMIDESPDDFDLQADLEPLDDTTDEKSEPNKSDTTTTNETKNEWDDHFDGENDPSTNSETSVATDDGDGSEDSSAEQTGFSDF